MSNKFKSLFSKGRLTLPKEVRDLAGIVDGDIFLVTVENNKLIFKKAKVVEDKN